MIEVFKVTNSAYSELVAEDVTWSGSRWKNPRKLEVNCVVKQNGQTFNSIAEGETVLFKWRGKELFRGTVFKRQYPSENQVKIIAYDLLQYLTRNEDMYAFSNVKLTDIFRKICGDFNLPIGTVADTGYTFRKMLFVDDTPLIDILLKGIRDTRAQKNVLYYVNAEKGKINLKRYPNPDVLNVLSTDSNVMDYTYETSIEETATQVKVRTTINDKVHTRTATDSSGRSKFGRLQHVEFAQTELNLSQLQQRANTRLSQKKGVKHTLNSVNAIGNVEFISAIPVQIVIPELKVNKKMFIDTDTHMFSGEKHLASLTLVDRNFVPTGSA